MEQHMHIEIQAVQKNTMSYRVYEYTDVKDVDKYIKMHNNSNEFVATYKIQEHDNKS